jgi:signal transduction histidine kinase
MASREVRRTFGGLPWRSSARLTWLRKVLISPLVLITVVSIVSTLASIAIIRNQVIERTRQANTILLNTFAISLAKHVEQAIKRGDDILKQNRHTYLTDRRNLERLLETHNKTIDREAFPLEGVIGVDGLMVASSTNIGIPLPKVNLSDREHFRVHLTADPAKDDIFFSKIVVGRVSGKPVMQITRGFRAPNGELLAVGVVSLNPEEFVTPYLQMGGSQNVITLLGDDRIGRLRAQEKKIDYSIDYTSSRLTAEILRRGNGTTTAASSVDGLTRIYAFRRVQDLPLTVVVGSPDINEASESIVSEIGAISFVGSLVLITLCGLLGLAIWSRILFLRLSESNDALAGTIRDMAMADTSQKHFVASVSHELRTPLHGILGHAQLLELDSPPGPLRESAEAIFKSAEYLRKIVTQLLDLARVEAGKEVLQFEMVSVESLIEEVCALHIPAAQRAGLKMTVDVEAVRSMRIRTDALALKRCLHNLINNAVKFTPSGNITVFARPGENNGVSITVSDTGIGIRKDDMDKIFDYYSYLSRTAKSNVAGTGLGLALCRKLVEMLSGSLTANSEPGKGSTFRITLPADPDTAAKPATVVNDEIPS